MENRNILLSGDVLVCEDDDISRQVIHAHLTKMGLTPTITINGLEGVEAAASHIAYGKPFDIILMDIHMPIMDGLQASDRLAEIGSNTPIIALTATVDSEELDEFRRHGLASYLVKPFKTQELWACIAEYLIPVNSSINKSAGMRYFDGDKAIYKHITNKFFTNNKCTPIELNAAMKTGDMRLVHRIAHSIKSSAGMIGAAKLSEAAYALERASLCKDCSGSQHVNNLARLFLEELNKVLDELASGQVRHNGSLQSSLHSLNRKKTLALINELTPLLKTGNSVCLEFSEEVNQIFRSIAEHCLLFITQMEQFNFEAAYETLGDIKMFITEE